jgi:protein CLEC16A
MFEDEYRQIEFNPIRIEYLLKDSCMLFPPSTTPLSGVEFIKRLPSGDIERARRVNLDSWFFFSSSGLMICF